jgi:hypothetical protein
MPQHCAACHSPHRLEIDRQIAAGIALRAVGMKYGLTHTSLVRHRQSGHLTDSALAEQRTRDLQRHEAVAGQAADLFSKVKALLVTADESHDVKTFVQMSKEARGYLDILVRITPGPDVARQLEEERQVFIQEVDIAIDAALDAYFANGDRSREHLHSLLAVEFGKAGL